MLEKEFNYFKENYKLLFEKYPNQFLVIKDMEVKNAFETFEQAIEYASTNFELGTFLIQECTKDENAYTQTFHSRVIFA
ncbi:MAG: hypothetical protein IKK23_04955 [Bacteroidales bacterium]|nr:hypothetical protein [Bacteroidales bacterium]MBR4094734.1 hypothetical protein [Bacteroidales bacterium]